MFLICCKSRKHCITYLNIVLYKFHLKMLSQTVWEFKLIVKLEVGWFEVFLLELVEIFQSLLTYVDSSLTLWVKHAYFQWNKRLWKVQPIVSRVFSLTLKLSECFTNVLCVMSSTYEDYLTWFKLDTVNLIKLLRVDNVIRWRLNLSYNIEKVNFCKTLLRL